MFLTTGGGKQRGNNGIPWLPQTVLVNPPYVPRTQFYVNHGTGKSNKFFTFDIEHHVEINRFVLVLSQLVTDYLYFVHNTTDVMRVYGSKQ